MLKNLFLIISVLLILISLASCTADYITGGGDYGDAIDYYEGKAESEKYDYVSPGELEWDQQSDQFFADKEGERIEALLEQECYETSDWTDLPHCEHMVGFENKPSYSDTSGACPNGCTLPPSGCHIKGNISFKTGEKIYHVPGQNFYGDTVISPEDGERWFCTEQEARANGWRKAYN